MNINLLIDAIVQQTTVLIAQLATAAGARTSLSNTANQVFVSLVSELKQQGLGNITPPGCAACCSSKRGGWLYLGDRER